jgi:hypothetical protein
LCLEVEVDVHLTQASPELPEDAEQVGGNILRWLAQFQP